MGGSRAAEDPDSLLRSPLAEATQIEREKPTTRNGTASQGTGLSVRSQDRLDDGVLSPLRPTPPDSRLAPHLMRNWNNDSAEQVAHSSLDCPPARNPLEEQTMDAQEYLDQLIIQSEAGEIPYVPGDVWEPIHKDGHSDLNLHMGDMLAEPDYSKDPYSNQSVMP